MVFHFKKIHTGKDLAISGIVILAGIGLFFLNKGLGGVIGVCGLLMLLCYKAGYKEEGQDLPLVKKVVEVSHSCRESVKDFLEGKDVEPALNKPGAGSIIRLEAYYNQEAHVAYAQLYDFSQYAYQEATEMVKLEGSRADTLISKL